MTSNFKKLLIASTALLTASAAQAQAPYFNQFYGFGDTLTDNGRVVRESGNAWTDLFDAAAGRNIYEGDRWSNAPVWYEVVPGLIGVPYVPENDLRSVERGQ